jgi:hypothetical protein
MFGCVSELKPTSGSFAGAVVIAGEKLKVQLNAPLKE